ncbi:hypothetical protein F443_02455 [Phytophthora nicotianae P1569]|uniref:Uncharacterized protein n=5 Tax=Phytophthora nicotianae TaxID=4792 RepID=V9FTG0_PHYNI|nr:hypothetical protein F443_02455 [Phytophthora nicotianae P1569]ETO83548.1 hypothetical protein F444_02449 [Phytophthora nicotianae P1976]
MKRKRSPEAELMAKTIRLPCLDRCTDMPGLKCGDKNIFLGMAAGFLSYGA